MSRISVHVGGGLPQCMLGYHPPSPLDQAPPWTRHPPGPGTPLDQASPWTRHPPCAMHSWRYGQRAGGMHPTGMQSCYTIETIVLNLDDLQESIWTVPNICQLRGGCTLGSHVQEAYRVGSNESWAWSHWNLCHLGTDRYD